MDAVATLASVSPAVPSTEVEAPQHMRALERANSVRLARAELKRAIARGDREAADVVSECPWETDRDHRGQRAKTQLIL